MDERQRNMELRLQQLARRRAELLVIRERAEKELEEVERDGKIVAQALEDMKAADEPAEEVK